MASTHTSKGAAPPKQAEPSTSRQPRPAQPRSAPPRGGPSQPFTSGAPPTIRPAAFSVASGPPMRPAFSAEGDAVPEAPSFAGHAHAEASPAFTDGRPGGATDEGVHPSDRFAGQSSMDVGFDGFEAAHDLPQHADAALDAAMEQAPPPSAASHAEAAHVEPFEGAPDEGGSAHDPQEAIGSLIKALSGAHAALTEEAKATAVTLGLAIARRVVGEQLAIDHAPLKVFIDEALEKVPAAATVRLFLSPDDVERVEDIESDAWHAPGRSVSVVVDEALQQGDCRLEAPGISMDGRLSTRVERLAQAARAALMLSDEGA